MNLQEIFARGSCKTFLQELAQAYQIGGHPKDI